MRVRSQIVGTNVVAATESSFQNPKRLQFSCAPFGGIAVGNTCPLSPPRGPKWSSGPSRGWEVIHMFASNMWRNPFSAPEGLALVMAHQHQNCHVKEIARASNVALNKTTERKVVQCVLNYYCITMFLTQVYVQVSATLQSEWYEHTKHRSRVLR